MASRAIPGVPDQAPKQHEPVMTTTCRRPMPPSNAAVAPLGRGRLTEWGCGQYY
jgi:hypothetical protein